MRSLTIASCVFVLVGATFACGTSGSDAEDPASEGALRTDAPEAVDQAIVGKWIDESGDQLIVSSLELRADGTFYARGGCILDDSGQRRCYQVDEAKGRWSAAGGAITLRDSDGQQLKYDYKAGESLVIKDGAKKATFKKLSANVVAPGGVCTNGRVCADGFECRDNCPPNARCIVRIDTCQPKATVQSGGVCSTRPDAPEMHCAEGLVCKNNCPQGAMCFAAIFTCQPE
jgi:hypothetical protein